MFLTSRFPWPLEKGDKLRAYHLIRVLSRYADVYLFAVNDCMPSGDQLAQLAPFCKEVRVAVVNKPASVWSMLKAAPSDIPFQAAYFYSQGALKDLKQFVASFKPDFMVCHLLRMGEYAKRIQVHPSLIDYMDTFSKGMERYANAAGWWMRPAARIEHKRLARYERELFNLFDHHTIISAQDRDCIPHPENYRIEVLPNGVDCDYYAPRSASLKYEMIFLGNMAYPPNIASAVYSVRQILPELDKMHPGCRLLIAGATPVKEVQELAGERVEVSGWLDDVRDAMASSTLMIAPMLISIGLQNKILQAMAMKIPCVVSTLANNAIGAIPEEAVLVADTPEMYAKQIHRLLTDADLRRRIAENAFSFVHATFSWDSAGVFLKKKLEVA